VRRFGRKSWSRYRRLTSRVLRGMIKRVRLGGKWARVAGFLLLALALFWASEVRPTATTFSRVRLLPIREWGISIPAGTSDYFTRCVRRFGFMEVTTYNRRWATLPAMTRSEPMGQNGRIGPGEDHVRSSRDPECRVGQCLRPCQHCSFKHSFNRSEAIQTWRIGGDGGTRPTISSSRSREPRLSSSRERNRVGERRNSVGADG
jgi:hypothetical protein